MTLPFEVVIIGGGIVGCAVGMALAGQGRRVIVVEKEAAVGAHQTGHNSGVIHSGLYYKPGSHKARMCVEGRAMLERFCEEEGIAFERCGKVVIATRQAELPMLEELAPRGRANGLSEDRLLGPEALREREPHAAGVAALLVPETGIVDYGAVVRAYAARIERAGGEVLTGARIHRIRQTANGVVAETTRTEITAMCLVNCGGLHSDRIAALSGSPPRERIVPFRGEYYELVEARRSLVRDLIYPVPDPAFPFLGVHFTRMIRGGVEAGPNAVLSLKREGYTKTSFSFADTWSTVTFGGFWRMARRHWRAGMEEAWRSYHKAAFVRSLQRLIPDVRSEDLVSAEAGVRAQALDSSGALVDDFRIHESPRMVHVLNAPSPAATSSIAIGQFVASRVLAQLA